MGGDTELAIERRDAADTPEHVVLHLIGHATPANHGVLTRSFQLVREELQARSQKRGGVILVMREMETISSSCVGAMLSLSRDLQKSGMRIGLAEVSGPVLQILDMLRLSDVFPVFDSAKDAHAGLREG